MTTQPDPCGASCETAETSRTVDAVAHSYRIVHDGPRVSLIHGPACPRCDVRP